MGTRFLNSLRCLGMMALAALVIGLIPNSALAQVDSRTGPFQLEANATKEDSICFTITAAGALTAAPSSGTCPAGYTLVVFDSDTDDWQNALGFGGGAGHALATSFVGPPTEPFNSHDDTTFFAGGSKDTNGISTGPWKFTTTTVQAKDDIEHAYAAAYTLENGHIGIYFGMDRLDASGDSTAGFWFVQDSTIGFGANKLWTGNHTNGDLLIVADFTTGGAEGDINAFRWSCSGTGATCDLNGSLVPAPAALLNHIGCDPRTGVSNFCAQVNGTSGLTAPWGFTGKPATITTFPQGTFIEGGIDLQALFGSNVPCFSTFFAETRSSTSPTAALQDVTPPVSFPLCGMSVVKVCNGNGTVSGDGTSVAYSFGATVTNDGIGALFNVKLHDTLPDGTTQDITVTLPDSCNGTACLQAGHSATVTNIPFTATTSNCHAGVTNCPNPLSATNTTTASGFTASSGGTEIFSSGQAATATCSTTVSSSLTIKKACDADNGGATLFDAGSVVEAKVFFKYQVCNTGASQLTSISVVDDWGSPLQHTSLTGITSLAPGACSSVLTGNYIPNSIDSTSGRYGFTDTVRVTGATASLGSNPTPAVGCPTSTDLACDAITCPICFDSVCTGQDQPSHIP